jgi:hypothetical protein
MASMRLLVTLVLVFGGLHGLSARPQSVTLPVRVQLLNATDGQAIATTYQERDVQQLIAVANEVWRQAEIQWSLESLKRTVAPRAAAFDSLVRGEIRRDRELLETFFPNDSLLRSGWNVLLLQDFGQIAGGVYFANLGAVVLAERGFGYELPSEGRGGRTLAHELGHSLGLVHVPCDSTRNIMALGCWQPGTTSSLTAEQIRSAREQARAGHPIRQWR